MLSCCFSFAGLEHEDDVKRLDEEIKDLSESNPHIEDDMIKLRTQVSYLLYIYFHLTLILQVKVAISCPIIQLFSPYSDHDSGVQSEVHRGGKQGD